MEGNMRTIQTRPTVLEIPFVNDKDEEVLRLYFDRSDENVNHFYSLIPDMEKRIKELDENPDIEFDTKEFMRNIADSFLGEGSFDKIYEINNSTFTAAKYVYQIAIGIKEEFEEEDKRAVFNKYK